MKEYGGYIELENFFGQELHREAIALNSGRGCLEYLIKSREIRKLFLPYFLCSSVKDICERYNIEVEYYHTDANFSPEFENKLNDGEWLYVVNYYGQISVEAQSELKNKYGNVIVDNVQAFFQMPVKDLDTIYSCRKFFGVADGAYLYTDALYKEPLEQDFSYERMHFLLGRYEKTASLFYREYVRNNKFFEKEPVKQMSALTHNLLRGIDYIAVCDRRSHNFEYLHRRFANKNRLQLEITKGAFMYPLFLENGGEIRKKLIQEKIYIPTLWPDVFTVSDSSDLEYDMAENILPLPIDQRYDRNDMEYIADEVERLMRESSEE